MHILLVLVIDTYLCCDWQIKSMQLHVWVMVEVHSPVYCNKLVLCIHISCTSYQQVLLPVGNDAVWQG